MRLRNFIQIRINRKDVQDFQCNICGDTNKTALHLVSGRESRSCYHCGSTLRLRSIIDVLSTELFGKSMTISQFPDKSVRGIGMSDSDVYALPLSKKVDYQNTYLHMDPRLDITSIDDSQHRQYDFIITSDVFEHVPLPLEKAFKNLHDLLKPGGLCVFSVPYRNHGKTMEHYPNLFDYTVMKKNGRHVLLNRTKDGNEEYFENLKFHGGDGATLELRLFTRISLQKHFEDAGFVDIKFHTVDKPQWGIIWDIDYSQTISVRRKK